MLNQNSDNFWTFRTRKNFTQKQKPKLNWICYYTSKVSPETLIEEVMPVVTMKQNWISKNFKIISTGLTGFSCKDQGKKFSLTLSVASPNLKNRNHQIRNRAYEERCVWKKKKQRSKRLAFLDTSDIQKHLANVKENEIWKFSLKMVSAKVTSSFDKLSKKIKPVKTEKYAIEYKHNSTLMAFIGVSGLKRPSCKGDNHKTFLRTVSDNLNFSK